MKSRDEILAHLTQVMVETFELSPAQLTLDANLRDTLGLDSIDAVDMAVKVQEYTGRKPSFSELRELHTLGDVVTLVENHLAQSAGTTNGSEAAHGSNSDRNRSTA